MREETSIFVGGEQGLWVIKGGDHSILELRVGISPPFMPPNYLPIRGSEDFHMNSTLGIFNCYFK